VDVGLTGFVAFDGNGNVAALVSTDDGSTLAGYEYAPSGETLKATGPMARVNPLCWSTQYTDDETKLVMYPARPYSPSAGRWLSRDTLGEAGGINLSAFTHNDLVNLIDPFGLWTRDTWSGGWASYTGTATAECGDTLSELARLITGRASDWSALGIPQDIKAGQKVNIAPLLVVLEDRMRKNVVSATRSFSASFGLPVTLLQGSGSAEVNQFFSGRTDVQSDCTGAAYLVEAKGLLDTVGAADFDRLSDDGQGYRYNTFPRVARDSALSQLKSGDWTYFRNYDDYPTGHAWQGENVIKVGDDQYWGFPKGALSLSAWYSALRNAYNAEMGRSRTDPIPGFNRNASFIDVAKVAMGTFDVRKQKKQ
jgi:RHS repeat-associated protein